MSSQIPLTLPNLPNLLTQPFSQIPNRNLVNLNFHAWLLESQQSRSRACLRQWQQELRLLKGDQSDQSMKQVGHFYKVVRHSSGGLQGTPVKSVADFLMCLFQDGKLQPSTTNGYRTAIADKLGNSPFNISKDENLTRLLDVSTETDPKARGESPPGTSPWFCTS